MKDWEKYEDQIFEKLKRDYPNAEIIKNAKIKGIFSKSKRQIDILVKDKMVGKDVSAVIDCKKFSKKINVKAVESFIGFLEDVKASIGVMITTIGYTKGADNRVKNYPRDISLDIVEFENFDDYHFPWYECLVCSDYEPPRYSEISFYDTLAYSKNGLYYLFDVGDCSYCGTIHVKCQGCGEYLVVNEDHFHECGCELFYSFEWTSPKDDPSAFRILLKDSDDQEIEETFYDPDQHDLFKQYQK